VAALILLRANKVLRGNRRMTERCHRCTAAGGPRFAIPKYFYWEQLSDFTLSALI